MSWLFTLIVIQLLLMIISVGGYFLYKRFGKTIRKRLTSDRFFYYEQDNLYERLN